MNLTLRSISIFIYYILYWLICCFLKDNMRHFQRKFVLSMVMRTLAVCAWPILISLWWIYLRIRTCGYLNDAVFFPLHCHCHCHCHCPQKTIMMISRHGNSYSSSSSHYCTMNYLSLSYRINLRPSYGLPIRDMQMWCSCSCPPGRTKRRQIR